MAGMVSRQCGMRNAECGMSGEGQRVSDLSLQFPIPYSALRIRNYRTNKLPDPLLRSLVAVTSEEPERSARTTTDWPDATWIRATVESLTVQKIALSPRTTVSAAGVTVTLATESVGGGGSDSTTTSSAEPRLP